MIASFAFLSHAYSPICEDLAKDCAKIWTNYPPSLDTSLLLIYYLISHLINSLEEEKQNATPTGCSWP